MSDFFGAVTPHQRDLLEEQEQLGVDVPADAVSINDVIGAVDPTGTAIPARSDEPKLEFLGTALNATVPVAYGRHLVAGAPIFQHKDDDSTTTLFVALGDGPWEGPEVIWVNGEQLTLSDTSKVHFHPGLDGQQDGSRQAINETTPSSASDPGQRNQHLCSFFPAGFTKMPFARTAYISLKLAPDPTAPGPDFDIRGIYKTRKVRIFDAGGNQTSFSFSSNPAWQLLDAFILLHLKPHCLAGETLTQAEKDRVDFAAFKAAADFCDADIGGGVKRFESHVVFLSETNLATIFDTLTALCRGYLLEQNGKLGLFIDQPRSSVYTFTRSNVLASGFQAPAKPLRSLANRLVIKTRDIDSGEGTISKDFAPWTKTLDDEPHQDRVGRIIKKDFDLGANTKERAERVGRYWMNRSLKLSEQGRLVASPDAGALVPGDRVTGPARTDFSSTRDWEVIEISDNPDGTREVSLQTYDESIFSDTAETQQGIEETTIPTRAQTAFSPTGTHFYLRAVYKPDQLNGSADTGDIDFDPRPADGDYLIGHPDGTDFVISNANRSRMSQGASESYNGRVFIIFSKQLVNSQRSLGAFQDSHILVVRLSSSGSWQYDESTFWTAFTPDPSDICIFEVDRSGSGWTGKPTRYVGQELLTHTEAGRLLYGDGTTVESLQPGEAGANVTETRTSNNTSNVGGTSAATVESDSADGKTSFDGTAEYRKAGVPTNNPSPSGITTTLKADGSASIRLDWSAYSQGSIKANGLMVFMKVGASPLSAPVAADPSMKIGVDVTAIEFTGLNQSDNFRFGIAAYRNTETGISVGVIQAPTSAPDWADVKPATNPSFTGVVGGATYTGGGTVDSLKPAESGADATSGKPLSSLSGDLDDISDGSTAKAIGQGTSFPGSPTANQFFYRTDTDELWQRNSGNTAWILRAGRSVENKTSASTGSPTTASGSFAVIPQMTITLTPKTTKLLILFSGTFEVTSATPTNMQLDIFVDDVAEGNDATRNHNLPGPEDKTVALSFLLTGLTVGTEITVDIRWRRFAGSGTIRNISTLRSLQIEDVL